MSESLFRKASLDSISSPEQLNDYIKVSTPSVWIVLAALIILVVAVLVWGFTGSLPTTVNAPCAVLDGGITCFLTTEDTARVQVGQTAWITGSGLSEQEGSVVSISAIPVSAAEVLDELNSDYLAQLLVVDAFAFKVIIAPDEGDYSHQQILDVRIVTESIRPIDFLLR